METNITAPKDWLREIEVEIEPEKLKTKLDGLLDTYKDKAEIPGFRKGKVPRDLLEKRFGPDLQNAAVEEIVEQASSEILKEHKLRPAAQVRLTDLEVTPEKAIRFRMRLEVFPEFELKDYKGLRLRKQEPTGFDEEFEKRLRALQDRCATFKPVSRPSQEHDFVVVDYKTLEGDKEIAKPKTNLMIEVGDQANFEEVNEVLTKVRPGDEKTAEPEIPEDHPDKELAGRKVMFKFTVREVKEKTVPEVSEELASDLGYESLDALRQDINEQVMADRAELVENGLKNQIFGFLVREYEFEPPESWVNANFERLRQEYKLPDDKDTRTKLMAVAAKRARFDVVAARIAKKEGIEVSEQEVQQEIETLARSTKRPAEELARLLDNPGFRSRLLREKVMEFILENADVS